MTLMADCFVCHRNIEDALCVSVSVDGRIETVCDDCLARAEDDANIGDPITDDELGVPA